jgi:hypothetical protein
MAHQPWLSMDIASGARWHSPVPRRVRRSFDLKLPLEAAANQAAQHRSSRRRAAPRVQLWCCRRGRGGGFGRSPAPGAWGHGPEPAPPGRRAPALDGGAHPPPARGCNAGQATQASGSGACHPELGASEPPGGSGWGEKNRRFIRGSSWTWTLRLCENAFHAYKLSRVQVYNCTSDGANTTQQYARTMSKYTVYIYRSTSTCTSWLQQLCNTPFIWKYKMF